MARPTKANSRLNKDIILKTALKQLDDTGEASLSFRTLAKELDVTAMAIKHHVGSRKDLLASLVSLVYANVADAPVTSNPRDAIFILLERYCLRVIEHPNLALCIIGDPTLLTGQLVVLTDKISEYLKHCDIEPSEIPLLIGIIIDYTHGFAFSAAAYSCLSDEEKSQSELSIDDYMRGITWVLNKIDD